MDGSEIPAGDVYERQWEALAAWFLGPKGENGEILKELIADCVESSVKFRQNFFPSDSRYITPELQGSEAYKNEVDQMRKELARINKDLQQTVPFFSTRYQGHMNWDTALPANVGYISGMLYNQNNVAAEGGPITTLMEIEVGNQLCRMLGYSTSQEPFPWGHITCGGTVANIEAAWASRNLKYLPLAIQMAVAKNKILEKAKSFAVTVHRNKGREEKLTSVQQWDLLNLDVDEIISMPERVAQAAEVPLDTLNDILKQYNLESLGFANFTRLHKISESPVVISPASNHYSWPKALTLLGLGDSNLLHIEVETTGRQSLTHLRSQLAECLSRKRPIIMVVAVMGTTEEGAIDPLNDILALRDEFKKKGLNFCVHADAAWGGYMCTMLDDNNAPSAAKSKNTRMSMFPSLVNSLPLNKHSHKQLTALSRADSITVDPHKTGLIPYPAGGLCYRNGSMRNFVTLTAPVVFHGAADPNIGVFGIEGSKPGASAVATLLAHRVIGLDQYGYGRILSQCMMGAKMFYCMWMCLARENDPFTCFPIVPLPDGLDETSAKAFIQTYILGKSASQLMQNKLVMNFLSEIGGDALVNAFVVNVKGNRDVILANKLMMSIFNKLVYSNTKKKNQRVPMIITQSEKGESISKNTLKDLKAKNDLDFNDSTPLTFLINTVLNPWLSSYDDVMQLGLVFRETVLLAIGDIQDHACNHGFISAGIISDDGLISGDHLPVFTETVHQYHAVAKFRFLNPEEIQRFKSKQLELRRLPQDQRVPVIFGNPDKMTLTNVVLSEGRVIRMDCFAGLPSETNPEFMTADAIVVDVTRFVHFDMTAKAYPETIPYWLFGDKNGTYMSHVMTKRPDMHQLVQLDKSPHSIPQEVLELGLLVTIPALSGEPFYVNGQLTDPLQNDEYTIEYIGQYGRKSRTTVYFGGDNAKIWTDFIELNVNEEEEGDKKETQNIDTMQKEDLSAAIRKALLDGGSIRKVRGSRMVRGLETRQKIIPQPSRSLEAVLVKDIRPYIVDTQMNGAYGMENLNGFDVRAPAHPGDVVTLKDFPNVQLRVEIVIPDGQVLLVTDIKNMKGIVKYGDVSLFERGSYVKPVGLS